MLLQTSPVYAPIFDENAYAGLREIKQNIENYSHLSYGQQWLYSLFLSTDVVVVNSETMPKLYEYIDTLCKEEGITIPIVFLTRKKGILNAAAQKILHFTGAVLIGHDLIVSLSDESLETVIAHEIGHIKYNHINKKLAIQLAVHIILQEGYHIFKDRLFTDNSLTTQLKVAAGMWLSSSLLISVIINKRFEKQADAFAYKVRNKGKGLIEFFKLILYKEAVQEEDFYTIKKLLQDHKSSLPWFNYLNLQIDYHLVALGHAVKKGYKWIYYNTPLGDHPSPEERIREIEHYLEAQNS